MNKIINQPEINKKNEIEIDIDKYEAVIDPNIINDIKTELQNEIISKQMLTKNYNEKLKAVLTIQKAFRKFAKRKAKKSKIKILQKKNLKISSKNFNAKSKNIPKAQEIIFMDSKANEGESDKIQNNSNYPSDVSSTFKKSPSLNEIRLVIGSEQRLGEDSIKKLLERDPTKNRNNNPSIFNKNTFDDFTLNKLKQMMEVNNVSAIIGIREEVMKYKESSEKMYINKMYKAKKITPKTYYRKRKELEKWVTKEREEIKKEKNNLIESWKRTENMIEEASHNAFQLKKLLLSHAASYNNDLNSNMTLIDLDRPERKSVV